MLFIRKRKKSKLILYREKGKKRKNYKWEIKTKKLKIGDHWKFFHIKE